MTAYRIDQHGPYRRWILVQNGVDISAHATLAEAERALAQIKALVTDAQKDTPHD